MARNFNIAGLVATVVNDVKRWTMGRDMHYAMTSTGVSMDSCIGIGRHERMDVAKVYQSVSCTGRAGGRL